MDTHTNGSFSGNDVTATEAPKRGRKPAGPKPLLGFDVSVTLCDGTETSVEVYAEDFGEACKEAAKVTITGIRPNGAKRLPGE